MKNPITLREKTTHKLFVIFLNEEYLFDIEDRRILPCSAGLGEAEFCDAPELQFTFNINKGRMSDCCNATLENNSDVCPECHNECNPIDLSEEITFYQIEDEISFDSIKEMSNWIDILEKEHKEPSSGIKQLNEIFTGFGKIFSPKSNKKSNNV